MSLRLHVLIFSGLRYHLCSFFCWTYSIDQVASGPCRFFPSSSGFGRLQQEMFLMTGLSRTAFQNNGLGDFRSTFPRGDLNTPSPIPPLPPSIYPPPPTPRLHFSDSGCCSCEGCQALHKFLCVLEMTGGGGDCFHFPGHMFIITLRYF